MSLCVKNSTSARTVSLYSIIVSAAVIGVAALGKMSLPLNNKAFSIELLPALTRPIIPICSTRSCSSNSSSLRCHSSLLAMACSFFSALTSLPSSDSYFLKKSSIRSFNSTIFISTSLNYPKHPAIYLDA